MSKTNPRHVIGMSIRLIAKTYEWCGYETNCHDMGGVGMRLIAKTYVWCGYGVHV